MLNYQVSNQIRDHGTKDHHRLSSKLDSRRILTFSQIVTEFYPLIELLDHYMLNITQEHQLKQPFTHLIDLIQTTL